MVRTILTVHEMDNLHVQYFICHIITTFIGRFLHINLIVTAKYGNQRPQIFKPSQSLKFLALLTMIGYNHETRLPSKIQADHKNSA